jgi:Zn-finger nucleic acid-binding protein
MNCPSCGAAMRLKEDAEFFTCGYCGNIQFPELNSDGVRVLGEPAGLACVVCTVDLVHAAVAGHRMRYCERCRGMLIGMEVFVEIVQDLRARRAGTVDAPRAPEWTDLNRRLVCSQCKRDMDTHLYGGPGNVVIDTCENCSVNWLDYSELERIVRAPDPQYVAMDPNRMTPMERK